MRNQWYRQGWSAWHKGKKLSDCPWKHGTRKWQSWVNGWGDRSDKAFLKLVKIYPQILVDSSH